MTSKYRYPGAQPFQTDQANIFYGRKRAIKELHQFIQLEKLVVLYAKSGLGKSSLVNAGLIPRLLKEEVYEPISIRFGAGMEGKAETPLSITKDFLGLSLQYGAVLDKLIPQENSLWYILKSRQMASGAQHRGYLLIFDQFEELFTYSEAEIAAFKEQLAELLYTSIPQRFLEKIQSQIEGGEQVLTEEEMAALHQPFEVKALLAIRSDRMHVLNGMSDYFPEILSRCYELGPLSGEEAEDAVISPAVSRNPNFISPPFDYEDEAIEKIIWHLNKGKSQSIESFQLQILCQSLERKVMEDGISLIKVDDIGDVETLYENYYDDQIARVKDPADQLAARRFIEEGLIFEEEERRLSMYEGQIYKTFNIAPQLLTELVDSHLLRAEPSMRGGYTYELSHDTLVAPVLKAKTRRKEQERREAVMRAEREREAALSLERKKRRRAYLVAFVGVLLAFIAAVTSVIAMDKSRIANKSLIEARENLAKFEKERDQRTELEIDQLLQDAEILMASSDYALAKAKIMQASEIDSTNVIANDKMQRLLSKLPNQ